MALWEWLLVIITVAIGTATVFVVRFLVKLDPAVDSLRRTSDRFGQATLSAQMVLAEVQAEVRQLQAITARADGVLADVEGVTRSTRKVAREAVGIVNLVGFTRRTRAITAGARAALGMLRNAAAPPFRPGYPAKE